SGRRIAGHVRARASFLAPVRPQYALARVGTHHSLYGVRLPVPQVAAPAARARKILRRSLRAHRTAPRALHACALAGRESRARPSTGHVPPSGLLGRPRGSFVPRSRGARGSSRGNHHVALAPRPTASRAAARRARFGGAATSSGGLTRPPR